MSGWMPIAAVLVVLLAALIVFAGCDGTESAAALEELG
jgi:hypothetical protein